MDMRTSLSENEEQSKAAMYILCEKNQSKVNLALGSYCLKQVLCLGGPLNRMAKYPDGMMVSQSKKKRIADV